MELFLNLTKWEINPQENYAGRTEKYLSFTQNLFVKAKTSPCLKSCIMITVVHYGAIHISNKFFILSEMFMNLWCINA